MFTGMVVYTALTSRTSLRLSRCSNRTGNSSHEREKDKALEWLEKAFEEHSGYLTSVLCDFAFENLARTPAGSL
jgi:hypothetical protein